MPRGASLKGTTACGRQDIHPLNLLNSALSARSTARACRPTPCQICPAAPREPGAAACGERRAGSTRGSRAEAHRSARCRLAGRQPRCHPELCRAEPGRGRAPRRCRGAAPRRRSVWCMLASAAACPPGRQHSGGTEKKTEKKKLSSAESSPSTSQRGSVARSAALSAAAPAVHRCRRRDPAEPRRRGAASRPLTQADTRRGRRIAPRRATRALPRAITRLVPLPPPHSGALLLRRPARARQQRGSSLAALQRRARRERQPKRAVQNRVLLAG